MNNADDPAACPRAAFFCNDNDTDRNEWCPFVAAVIIAISALESLDVLLLARRNPCNRKENYMGERTFCSHSLVRAFVSSSEK